MTKYSLPPETLRGKILEVCKGQFCSLGEICELLQANKHTVRAGYLYPMVREGLLIQEYPPGTKSTQRYKAAGIRLHKESR